MSTGGRPSADGGGEYGLVRGGAISIAGQAFRSAFKLAAQIVIARFLLPADYGLVAMVAPILALVQLLSDFGLGQAVVQSREIAQSELSALFWLGTALNVLLSVIMASTAPLFTWLYHEPRLTPLVIALSLLVPLSGFSAIPVALLTREIRFIPLAALDVIPPALALTTGIYAATAGMNYWALVVSLFTESASLALLAWCMSPWRPVRPARSLAVWRLVQTGGHLTGYSVAQFVTTTVDNVLLSIVWGATALGLYDKGYKIVTQPVGQLLTPFTRLAMPLLVRADADVNRYKDVFGNILRIVVFLLYPGLVFILVMTKPLVSLLLGNNWLSICPVINWLCVGCFAVPVYNSTYWLFVSQGRAAYQLRYSVLTSIVSVTGFIAGLPWGPTGVAAAAGLTFLLLSTPIMCWGATRGGFITLWDMAHTMWPSCAAALLTGCVLFAITHCLPVSAQARLAIGSVFAYACFYICLLMFPGERRVMLSLLQRSF